jgi:glutamyl-tRNA synthetase
VFKEYRLPFDEGAYIKEGDTEQTEQCVIAEKGAYGPYKQRQRAHLYHICAKYLIEKGEAYPCFMTEDELSKIREEQAENKVNYGVYGSYARCRDMPLGEIEKRINSGEEYVVRYRSAGNMQNRVKVADLARGVLDIPENDQDVVLLKADGIPTYHFAHVVDDHFMRTTVVVRGEEWLATLPIHVQLFAAMGWKIPKYLHTAQLMKMDNGNKRKLSKRKDPELALSYYSSQGYTVSAVKEYLMSLLNSNFEDWRAANPDAAFDDFPFSAKKMGVSGALFDTNKLDDVSRNVLARMKAEDVYDEMLSWAKSYDADFAALLENDKAYACAFIAIGRGGKKPRKDIATWQDAKEYYSLYYDDLFAPEYVLPDSIPAAAAKKLLDDYKCTYDENDDASAWFEKVKQLAARHGYADDMKAYKQSPDAWPGSVADVSMVIRLAVAGRPQSPELCDVMKVMGRNKVQNRLEKMINEL